MYAIELFHVIRFILFSLHHASSKMASSTPSMRP
jgi:hypothetical protein